MNAPDRRKALRLIPSVALACAFPAASTAQAAPHPASFDGQCSFTGLVRFTPAITARPVSGNASATGRGTCTGDLVVHGKTRHLTNAAAVYAARSHSDVMGCAGGPASGGGTIRIGRQSLPFTMQETRVAAASELHLVATAWTGDGTAMASTSANPVAIATACAGPGLRAAPIDLSIVFRAS